MRGLTDDMERLREEIGNLRLERASLVSDLQKGAHARHHNVAEMRAGFRRTHAETSRRCHDARAKEMSDLVAEVAAMRSAFRGAHARTAREAKAERLAFIADQKRAVLRMRQGFAGDLAGARRAWSGPTPAEVRAAEAAAEAAAASERERARIENQRAEAEHEQARLENQRRAEAAAAMAAPVEAAPATSDEHPHLPVSEPVALAPRAAPAAKKTHSGAAKAKKGP